MASGICIFAEHYQGKLEPVTAELIAAANTIKNTTGESVKAILLANDVEPLVQELSCLPVEEIHIIKTDTDIFLEDDICSQAIANLLKELSPSSMLVPATQTGRSIFSRVAVKLGCGMTADCTELVVDKKLNGTYYIKQNKPSYGDNIFVSIITADNIFPQMMTIRPGVYKSAQKKPQNQPKVFITPFTKTIESGVHIKAVTDIQGNSDSIVGSEKVVVGGRGVLENDNLELMMQFANQLGAAIGGTRPLIDAEVIPFENQIGQTGCTIRPKLCVSFGVSGAIQHTEGIKDAKLMIAINQDENAPIFGIANYGLIGDIGEILKEYMNK